MAEASVNQAPAEKVRDRVKKLLAMAQHERSNEHEAEVAMKMAERLMREHNIELAELESSTGTQTVYTWRSITIPVGEFAKRQTWFPMWIGYLSMGVAKFTDCKVVRIRNDEYGDCVKFQGDETDLEYAAWLFKKLCDFGYAESRSVPGAQRETFRRSYAIRLQERMRALKQEQTEALRQAVTTTGTALMVVQNKIALRDAEFGKQKVSHRLSRLGSQGFHEGRAAADRATFNRPIGGAQQRRLS
jgi:hypothetical protein